ncbi:MAG TPA: LysR family transcriptional regulator [Noviherbaspirillum sp.]|nr:LysR family transcriptional regulator [Noviherbaspirillum sp.]
MDDRVLRAFCDIAENGSLTRAAAILGEKQSALSRRVAALEDELGGRLFYRTGRGMTLTDLGERLLPRIQSILAETDALVRDAQGERDSPTGVVEIGVVPALSQPLVSGLCKRLRVRYPGIRLRAFEGYSGQVEEWLANGKVELAVCNSYGRGMLPGAQLLLQSGVALVGPHQMLDGIGSETAFPALRDVPLVLPTRPNVLVSKLVDIAARHRFTLQIALEAGTGSLIRDAVQHVGLCTVLPLVIAERDFRAPDYVISRLIKPSLQQKAWLLASTQRPVSRAARLVQRMISDIAAQAAYERLVQDH